MTEDDFGKVMAEDHLGVVVAEDDLRVAEDMEAEAGQGQPGPGDSRPEERTTVPGDESSLATATVPMEAMECLSESSSAEDEKTGNRSMGEKQNKTNMRGETK